MPFVFKSIKTSFHSNLKRQIEKSHMADDVSNLGLILKMFYDKCYLAVLNNCQSSGKFFIIIIIYFFNYYYIIIIIIINDNFFNLEPATKLLWCVLNNHLPHYQFNKLTSVFYASVLLLIMNCVITLSK